MELSKKKKSALLDKSIVLDLLLARPRLQRILQLLNDYNEIYISSHTFVTCFYVTRKYALTKEKVYQDLSDFYIAEVNGEDCKAAYKKASHADDIEDCLELQIAQNNDLVFVTADKELVKKYKENLTFQLVS